MINISLSTIYSAPKGIRFCYNVRVHDNCMPNCCLKWSEKLKSNISWNTVFMKVQKTKQNKNVKLKWLQIRIIHRITATNVVLNNKGVTTKTQCGFCNDEKDSSEHIFWKCSLYQTFLDFAGSNIERKMWDSAKRKIYTKPRIVWNRNRHENWLNLWLSDTSSLAIYIQMQTRQVLANYHWRELPQVSFLSRQMFCHDKHVFV